VADLGVKAHDGVAVNAGQAPTELIFMPSLRALIWAVAQIHAT